MFKHCPEYLGHTRSLKKGQRSSSRSQVQEAIKKHQDLEFDTILDQIRESGTVGQGPKRSILRTTVLLYPEMRSY